MDVAFPAHHRRSRPDDLVYSLRTLNHHFKVDRVFVAGGNPHLTGITHIPTPEGLRKWESIGANLRAILDSDISDEFLWMNDDFFMLADVSRVKPMVRGDLRDRVIRQEASMSPAAHYQQGMRAQFDILTKWGFENPLDFDVHVPMTICKPHLKEVLFRATKENPDHCVGHFRSLYGNLTPEKPQLVVDPKVTFNSLPDPSWGYVATDRSSWKGRTGKMIRDRYWRASPWEAA